MSTLLLRLAAPLQSYGTDSKFDKRMTGKEPSKSAVVGLLAAALGRKREESLEDLTQLHFGVRVDQEGTLLRDLHTAKSAKTSYLTFRYYLSDAIFLVGVESEDAAFLQSLEDAIHHPAFPLYLGRRSCPPTLPLSLGIRNLPLEEALKKEPWLAKKRGKEEKSSLLRILLDAPDMTYGKQRDFPISFSSECREMTYRGIRSGGYVEVREDHDAMAELR